MRVSSQEPGLRAIGRMCGPQSSASETSFVTSTRPSTRSKTTPASGTAGRSQPEVHRVARPAFVAPAKGRTPLNFLEELLLQPCLGSCSTYASSHYRVMASLLQVED